MTTYRRIRHFVGRKLWIWQICDHDGLVCFTEVVHHLEQSTAYTTLKKKTIISFKHYKKYSYL